MTQEANNNRVDLGGASTKLPWCKHWPAKIEDFEFSALTLREFATNCDTIARRVYSDLSHGNDDDVKRDVMAGAIVAR